MECKIGLVRKISNGEMYVTIERHSACSGCHAKGLCTSLDQKEQELRITEYPLGIQEGDLVRVVPVTRAKPIKAIVFAFVIPLVLMLISAVVMNALDVSEDVMVLGLLVLLLLYALVLRGMRGYFEREFRLTVEPMKQE